MSKKRPRGNPTLGLSTSDNRFLTFLCEELNKQGIPLTYSGFKLICANWWIGYGGHTIPDDNELLSKALETAVSEWQSSNLKADKLPGFIVTTFRKYADETPSSQRRSAYGSASVGEIIQTLRSGGG